MQDSRFRDRSSKGLERRKVIPKAVEDDFDYLESEDDQEEGKKPLGSMGSMGGAMGGMGGAMGGMGSYSSRLNHEYSSTSYSAPRPVTRMKRNVLLYIIFNMFSCGLYDIYWQWKVGEDLNTIQTKHDSKTTCNYIVILFASFFTMGISIMVWHNNRAKRIGEALDVRGFPITFSERIYWTFSGVPTLIVMGCYFLSSVFAVRDALENPRVAEMVMGIMGFAGLGTLVVAVLSYIYIYKVCEAMNTLMDYEDELETESSPLHSAAYRANETVRREYSTVRSSGMPAQPRVNSRSLGEPSSRDPFRGRPSGSTAPGGPVPGVNKFIQRVNKVASKNPDEWDWED